MKRVLLAVLFFAALSANAQFTESRGTIKLGTGYVQDFPGLGGYGITGEFSMEMLDRFEGGIGIKRLSMQGFPRTQTVKEYTRATTVDFNLYYLPLRTEAHIVRLGAGYSFSFYQTRRSYPVTVTNGAEKETQWPMQDAKSRTSGLTLLGEYEYLFANSNVSLGARAALYKAYDRVMYVGPFVGVRF
jgi:hypothetical protein